MDDIIAWGDDARLTISKKAFYRLVNWFFGAALAFIGVGLGYQLLVGALSYFLGYETHIHFGKVDSLPAAIQFWSDTKVLLLYAFPALLLLLFSIFTLLTILWAPKGIENWKWVSFWFVVFGILFSTTLFSISFISAIFPNRAFFQGFAVVKLWFGLSAYWAIAFTGLAAAVNIIFGFLCANVLHNISPSVFGLTRNKKGSRQIVIYSFIYPLVLLFPVTMLIAPHIYLPFFVVVFLHACFWLPGLFNIAPISVWQRKASPRLLIHRSNYLMLFITALVIVIVRIFFK